MSFSKAKDYLKTIFGNTAGDNLIVNQVPTDTMTVERIKKRNKKAIETINAILKKYTSKKATTTNKEDVLIIAALKELLTYVDFYNFLNIENRTVHHYSSADEFTELIGAYVPNEHLEATLKCAHKLAEANFNFENFGTFLPVKIPKNRPTSSDNASLPKIQEYEKELKKAYANCLPELFHTDEYNYKKGRKKYPHEMYKWTNDSADIDDDNVNEDTRYYNSIYQDYVFYRKNERRVVQVKKAPSNLLKKFFSLNEITMTLHDIGEAIHRDNYRYAADGTQMTEGVNRIIGFFEKLRITALLSGGGYVVKGLVLGFGSVSLGSAVLTAGGVAIAWQFVTMVRRIYNGYREIMEERVQINFAEDALKELGVYKKQLERCTDPEERRRLETIIKTYLAYYIANYNKYMRSVDRVAKNLREGYKDDKELVQEKNREYQETYEEYWEDAEKLAPKYRNLNKEEIDKKLDAIKKGGRRY